MAERRMFAKKIIDSDEFLDMPLSTQALYFHLCMRADDDGFTASAKRIVKTIDAKEDDLKILFAKQFIIPFETGVVVIKHWKIHNYIQADRYKESIHLDEKRKLEVTENKSYSLENDNVYKLDTECSTPCTPSLGKVRLDKSSKDNIYGDKPQTQKKKTKKTFIPPTLEEVQDYAKERDSKVDPKHFFDFYEAENWCKKGEKMASWKGTFITWDLNNKKWEQNSTSKKMFENTRLEKERASKMEGY